MFPVEKLTGIGRIKVWRIQCLIQSVILWLKSVVFAKNLGDQELKDVGSIPHGAVIAQIKTRENVARHTLKRGFVLTAAADQQKEVPLPAVFAPIKSMQELRKKEKRSNWKLSMHTEDDFAFAAKIPILNFYHSIILMEEVRHTEENLPKVRPTISEAAAEEKFYTHGSNVITSLPDFVFYAITAINLAEFSATAPMNASA